MDAAAGRPTQTQVDLLMVESYQNCSYCSLEDGSAESWLQSKNLTSSQYQMLLDRGWRRVGYFICKSIVEKACCRQYAIRCNAADFKLSKSQRRVLKRMSKFLMTEGDDGKDKRKRKIEAHSHPGKKTEESTGTTGSISYLQSNEKLPVDEALSYSVGTAEVGLSREKAQKIVKKTPCRGSGPDPNKPKCLKSKLRRGLKKGESLNDDLQTTADPYILIRSSIPHLNPSPRFKRNLKVILVPADESDPYFHSTAKKSYEVFKKFQTVVLKEPESEWSFSKWARCFIDCPVQHDFSGTGPGYGNFHQHYVLDGEIIAVGVITLIPTALVTEYFYYNPDYSFLTLGIYSAINEICFMNELYRTDNRYRRYYLGAYTHSSPKMRYKLQFTPSEILCPHTYKWISLQDCLPYLSSSRPRLNPSTEGDDPDQNEVLRSTFDLNKLLVCYQRDEMTFQEYKMICASDEPATTKDGTDKAEDSEIMKEYVALVGDVCATHIPLRVPISLYPA